MKRQIRQGVFETNSSSVHSITMCSKKDYDKWTKGEVLITEGDELDNEFIPYDKEAHANRTTTIKSYISNCCDFSEVKDNFDTEEEFEKYCEDIMSKINDVNYIDIINNNDISVDRYDLLYDIYAVGLTYDEWWSMAEYYEAFEKEYNGVMAFGYYGNEY